MCPPKKKKPFGGPASLCARPIAADSADGNHCSNPLFAPLMKVFGKRMGARGKEPFSGRLSNELQQKEIPVFP